MLLNILRTAVIAMATVLTLSPGGQALAGQSEAALRAMERMQFRLWPGDEGHIEARLADRAKGRPAAMLMRLHYLVASAEQPRGAKEPTSFGIEMRVLHLGAEGKRSPAGFDEVVHALFPLVRLKANADLSIIEMTNWLQIIQHRKDSIRRLKARNPKAAKMARLLLRLYSQSDMLVALFRPIAEMQRPSWHARGDGFDLVVHRQQGQFMGEPGQLQVAMTGKRRVVPFALANGRVRALVSTV